MTVLIKKQTSLYAKLFFTLLIILSSFLVANAQADAISVSSSANPAWPNKCGIKIGLLIDRSNSISTSEGNQFKSAAKGFVDALAGTSSEIAVAQFRKTATQTLGLTSVATSGGQTTVKNTIDGYTFGTSDSAGSTNWESAFYTQQSVAADVIIILTDGNPTSRDLDGEGGNGSSDPADFNIDAGITRANELKAQGKRVVAVGIGSDVDSANLAAVSGPTLNSDYFTSSFDSLNSKLTEIATTICGGTVTVTKQVKNTDGSYTNTNGWEYTATNAVSNTKTTAGQGTAEFKYENAPKNTTITETLKSGYVLESISCTKNGQATGSTQGLGVSLTVNSNDIISCVFKNKPTTGKVTVIKQVKNANGAYTNTNGWDYTATNAVVNSKTTAGSGSAQFDYETTPKSTTITETVKSNFSVESVSCTDAQQQSVATSTNASVTFNVPTNADITCVFKNKPDSATLTVVKNASGGNGTFNFTSTTPLGNFGLTTVSGTASSSSVSIPTGVSYDLTESALSGWTLDSASCTGTTATKTGSKLTFTAAKDANIVCTFNNSRDSGTIKVIKNATGGNGTFNFTSNSALGNFALTTSGGTASTAVTSVPTGTYDISESVPAGWSLNNLVCTGNNSNTYANPKVTVTVAKGDNVVCTFTNIRQTATLTVIKKTVGGNGTFSFTSNSALGDFNLTTVAGTASTAATTIPTGTYKIKETVPAGWTLTDITCAGNTTGSLLGTEATIDAAVSQNIVCTFTNTRDSGNITIVKNAVGGNGTFQFNSSIPSGNFSLTTQLGTASTGSINVPTGTYDVSEVVPSGWSLSLKNCSDSTFNNNNPVVQSSATGLSVSVAKNSNITCTFTNSRDTGSITIVKKSIGGNGTFTFSTNTPLGSPSITTTASEGSTSTVSVNSGTYNIAEDAKTGWTLTDLTCTGGSANYILPSVAVTVAKGDNVVCTFTNTRDSGTLTVVKNTVGGNGTFQFTSDTPFGNFGLTTVNNTASTSSVTLNTGQVNIAETVPSGWTLSAISCTGGSADREGNGVLVEINKGANVVCTFTNTRDTGTLRVIKYTEGSNDTFSFTTNSALGNFNLTTIDNAASTGSQKVDTGSYTITESALSGWTLTDLNCDGGNPNENGSSVTVSVGKGQDVTCYYTNTRDTGSLTVVKNATGGNGTFQFNTNTPLDDFALTTVGGTASSSKVSVNTGSYEIQEVSQDGWTLDSLSCTNGNAQYEASSAFITVTKGADVVCTFTNSRDTGTIKVVKKVNAKGGITDGAFMFSTNIEELSNDGGFVIETENGTGETETVTIPTGFYNVSEGVPADFNLVSQECTGTDASEDGGLYFEINKGDEIVCTFTNEAKVGKITVVKNVNEAGGVSDGSFDFESDVPGLDDFNLTTQGGTASTQSVEVPVGSYNIDEIVPEGWNLDSVSCVDLNQPEIDEVPDRNEIDAASGEAVVEEGSDVVCTFTNTRDTLTIQVIENSIGGDDTFPFTLTPEEAPLEGVEEPVEGSGTFSIMSLLSPSALSDLSAFNLVTVAGTNQTAVVTIPTGTYSLAQIVPANWTLTSLQCVGTNGPVTVSPKITFNGLAGQNIVCTYVNTKTQVQGTVVTRPTDTVIPPQVKGISVSNLPATGSEVLLFGLSAFVLILAGSVFFISSRKRKTA